MLIKLTWISRVNWQSYSFPECFACSVNDKEFFYVKEGSKKILFTFMKISSDVQVFSLFPLQKSKFCLKSQSVFSNEYLLWFTVYSFIMISYIFLLYSYAFLLSNPAVRTNTTKHNQDVNHKHKPQTLNPKP